MVMHSTNYYKRPKKVWIQWRMKRPGKSNNGILYRIACKDRKTSIKVWSIDFKLWWLWSFGAVQVEHQLPSPAVFLLLLFYSFQIELWWIQSINMAKGVSFGSWSSSSEEVADFRFGIGINFALLTICWSSVLWNQRILARRFWSASLSDIWMYKSTQDNLQWPGMTETLLRDSSGVLRSLSQLRHVRPWVSVIDLWDPQT